MTDANLALGYLDPHYFYGGELELDQESVTKAIDEQIRRPLGLGTVEEAAYGIFRMVNASMANAIRRVSAQRGVDPRDLPLVAFGGNGPVHAGMQAAELGIKSVLIPKSAPTFSAVGLLLTDPTVYELRSYITSADKADLSRVSKLYAEMEKAALRSLSRAGFKAGDIEPQRIAYLCYPGQTFDMPIPLTGDGAFTRHSRDAMIEAFHRVHEELHTYASRDQTPILRAVSIQATARTAKPRMPRLASSSKPPTAAQKGRRKAYFEGKWQQTPVYDGALLRARQTVKGPAIIEEPLTTVVVYPGQKARLDALGNYHLEVGSPAKPRGKSRTG